MPVREFNGSSDAITFSPGGIAGNLNLVAYSIFILVKPLSSGVSGRPFITGGQLGVTNVFGFYDNGDGSIAHGGDSGDSYISTGFETGVWEFFGITRASGSGVTPRGHRIGTGGWSHVNATGPSDIHSDSSAAIFIGKWPNSGGFLHARVAFMAFWKGTLLSDADYEAMAASASTDLVLTYSPTAFWEFNQASTSTAVQDIVGGADETSISGTTVVTTDNPVWAFSGETAPAHFVNAAGQQYTGGGNATANVPIGTQVGDQMIGWLIYHGNDAASVSTPSGWTFVETFSIGFWWFNLYRKIADSSEPSSYTWITGAVREGQTNIASYRGVEWDLYDGVTTAETINNPETPSITPSVDNCFVLGLFGANSTGALTSITADVSPAATERRDFVEFGSASISYLEDYTQTTATATSLGCTGNTTSSRSWAAIAISLAPSAPAVEPQSYYATRRRVGR